MMKTFTLIASTLTLFVPAIWADTDADSIDNIVAFNQVSYFPGVTKFMGFKTPWVGNKGQCHNTGNNVSLQRQWTVNCTQSKIDMGAGSFQPNNAPPPATGYGLLNEGVIWNPLLCGNTTQRQWEVSMGCSGNLVTEVDYTGSCNAGTMC